MGQISIINLNAESRSRSSSSRICAQKRCARATEAPDRLQNKPQGQPRPPKTNRQRPRNPKTAKPQKTLIFTWFSYMFDHTGHPRNRSQTSGENLPHGTPQSHTPKAATPSEPPRRGPNEAPEHRREANLAPGRSGPPTKWPAKAPRRRLGAPPRPPKAVPPSDRGPRQAPKQASRAAQAAQNE